MAAFMDAVLHLSLIHIQMCIRDRGAAGAQGAGPDVNAGGAAPHDDDVVDGDFTEV